MNYQVLLKNPARAVQASVHFSYNRSQLLPYIEIRKMWGSYAEIIWSYLLLFRSNWRSSFISLVGVQKTTSPCRVDFVRENKFSKGMVPQSQFVSTNPTDPTAQWNVDSLEETRVIWLMKYLVILNYNLLLTNKGTGTKRNVG